MSRSPAPTADPRSSPPVIVLLAALAAVFLAASPSAPPRPGGTPERSGRVESEEIRLVLIDAVVTGPDGRPVPGLAAGEFRLRIDGRAAAIAAFEDRCPAPGPAGPAPVAAPGSEIATFLTAAQVRTNGVPPQVVLWFDLPHLSTAAAGRSIEAARRWLERAPPETRILVAAFGPAIRVLVPFTADRAAVARALDAVTGGGATFDDGPVARTLKVQELAGETCMREVASGEFDSFDAACPNLILRARQLAHEEWRSAQRSLDALRSVLVALSSVSGRKALVLFNESLGHEPGAAFLALARRTARSEQIEIEPDLRAVVDEAAAAGVSVYTVYAPGLEDAGDAEMSRTASSLGTKAMKEGVSRNLRDRENSRISGRYTMDVEAGPIADALRTAEGSAVGFNASVAAQTGGRALGRTNDLDRVFPLVEEDLACGYVLAYAPEGPADGRRHAIGVETAAKGTTVRARSFFVDRTEADREARRFEVALAAPGAFRGMPLEVDAFAVGRTRKGWQVLVTASIPIDALEAGVRGFAPGTVPDVRVRGRAVAGDAEACRFEVRSRLAGAAGGDGGVLVVEAECDLPAGRSEIVAVAEERHGGALAADRREVVLADPRSLFVGEAQMWSASRSDRIDRSSAASIFGEGTGLESGRAVPRTSRRLLRGEAATLFVLVCPPRSGAPGAERAAGGGPWRVTRALLAGEEAVATFPPLAIGSGPTGGAECWGVASDLPAGVLGDGVYDFVYEVHAPGAEEPIRRRASFLVGEAGGAEATVPGPPAGAAPPTP